MKSLALGLSLTLASSSVRAESTAAAERSSELRLLIKRIESAEHLTNEDPARGIVLLRQALSDLVEQTPELANDPEAQKTRLLAQLALTRALLAQDQRSLAEAAMDEALRLAGPDPVPADLFGPRLLELAAARQAGLPRTGSLSLQCQLDCRVFLDEREVTPDTQGLWFGPYRLWIQAKTPGAAPDLRREFVLDSQTPNFSLQFPPNRAAKPAPVLPRKGKIELQGRVLPRWLEITSMGVGVAVLGIGAAMFPIGKRLDGTCPQGGEETGPMACAEVYSEKTFATAGIALLVTGGVFLLAGAIMLAVDETRFKRKNRGLGRRP